MQMIMWTHGKWLISNVCALHYAHNDQYVKSGSSAEPGPIFPVGGVHGFPDGSVLSILTHLNHAFGASSEASGIRPIRSEPSQKA